MVLNRTLERSSECHSIHIYMGKSRESLLFLFSGPLNPSTSQFRSGCLSVIPAWVAWGCPLRAKITSIWDQGFIIPPTVSHNIFHSKLPRNSLLFRLALTCVPPHFSSWDRELHQVRISVNLREGKTSLNLNESQNRTNSLESQMSNQITTT